MPVLYTSTRTLEPFENSEPTGLKVDIAENTYDVWLYWEQFITMLDCIQSA